MSNWNDVKKNITSLSQEDWDEVDLKVKIVGEILEARKRGNINANVKYVFWDFNQNV